MSTAQNSTGELSVALADPAATRSFAARLAAIVRPGDVIALTGDLGMGKTTFARYFINEMAMLNGRPVEDVPSPTFTLVQIYPMADFSIYHMDLYRLEHPAESLELGIEEAFDDHVTLIEWPDRLGEILPNNRLDISILPGDSPDARRILLDPHDAWKDRLNDRILHG